MYEGLASYLLPERALKYFAATDFATQRTSDQHVLYTTEPHLSLHEPDYYYSQPVACFHGHLSPAGKVVAGAVGVAAVAAFVGALCH